MQKQKLNKKDAERRADALIASEKLSKLKKEGILLEDDIPYAHSSSYGGRAYAFLPKRLKSNNVWIGLLILIVVVGVIELLDYFF